MTDEIILGNGDSRYLKSVSDFLTRYPTYEDMVAALVAGTLPIDLNGKNSAGIAQSGTALNKANLLADATATAAGLTSTATPNEVLANLAALYPVINNKSAISYTSLATGDKLPLADVSAGTAKTVTLANLLSWFTTTNKIAKIQIGSYVGTGTYGADNPCSITFDFAPSLVFGHSSASGGSGSSNPTNAQVYFGSNVIGSNKGYLGLVNMELLSTAYKAGRGFANTYDTSSYAKKSSDGKTLYWYNTESYSAQINAKDIIYSFVAIG